MLEKDFLPSTGNLASGKVSSAVTYNDAKENILRNSDWWVVISAFDLPDFEPSPLWISKRTGLQVEVIVEALEGLALLGYLRKEGGAFFPVKGKDFIDLNVDGRKKSEVIEKHTTVSYQVLNGLSENSVMAVDHRCFASNLEILNELYSDISQAMEKAYNKSMNTPNKDKIFKMSFTAVDVINEKGR